MKLNFEAPQKSADQFVERAEDSRNISWIAKSNSLGRTAKEKMVAVKDIREQLDGKLQQLKNS